MNEPFRALTRPGDDGGPAVEGELIVPGRGSRRAVRERLKVRLLLAGVTGLVGAGLLAVGAVFTLTVIGAFVGLPLMASGFAVLSTSAWLLLGGRFRVHGGGRR